MEDVQHDLIVRFNCPGCNKQCHSEALAIPGTFICKCKAQTHVRRHPNGRITVLYDPTQEAKP